MYAYGMMWSLNLLEITKAKPLYTLLQQSG